MELELMPKAKRAKGDICREPVFFPDIDRAQAESLASVAKALGDPVRIQLLDVLRRHAGEVCVCELVPLFDISQPSVSHHLKVLRDAGLVQSEKRGLWAYYFIVPGALDELSGWVLRAPDSTSRPGSNPEHVAGTATRTTWEPPCEGDRSV